MNILKYYITRTRVWQAFLSTPRSAAAAPVRAAERRRESSVPQTNTPGIDFCRILSYFVDMKAKFRFAAICALLLVLTACAAIPLFPSAAFAESFSVAIEDGTAVWAAANGATSYTVAITEENGGELFRTSTTETFFPVAEYIQKGGKYTVTVTAYADTETVASASTTFTHTIRLTPPSPTFSDGVLSWANVPGATGYSVTVNGVPLDIFTETHAELGGLIVATGEYSVSVTAEGDEFNLTSEPALLTFSHSAPPLPPYGATVAETDGRTIVTWTIPSDGAPEYYVYSVISEDKTLVSDTCTSNAVDITEIVKEGGSFVLTIRSVSAGKESAPFTYAFEIAGGGD